MIGTILVTGGILYTIVKTYRGKNNREQERSI
jgi:hypothetical protein